MKKPTFKVGDKVIMVATTPAPHRNNYIDVVASLDDRLAFQPLVMGKRFVMTIYGRVMISDTECVYRAEHYTDERARELGLIQ